MEEGLQSAGNLRAHSGMGKASVPMAILGLIAFFLPWLEVSCGPVKLQLSGYELATGRGLEPERYQSFYNKLDTGLESKSRLNRSKGNVLNTPNPQHSMPTAQGKTYEGTPVLWVVPGAFILIILTYILGVPRMVVLWLSAVPLAYLILFFVGNEMALNDPANTGGVIGHHWTLGFWMACLALTGEVGIALPRRSVNSRPSRSALGTGSSRQSPHQATEPVPMSMIVARLRVVRSALWALTAALIILRVAPIPVGHAVTLNRLCVLGAVLFGVPALFLTSLPVSGRAREFMGWGRKSEAFPIPVVPTRSGAFGSSPSKSNPGVYTYSAPGMPMCPECGCNPTIFHCTTHGRGLCLECVAKHDDPKECVYVPAFRAPKANSGPGETSGPEPPPSKHKPGDVFGIS